MAFLLGQGGNPHLRFLIMAVFVILVGSNDKRKRHSVKTPQIMGVLDARGNKRALPNSKQFDLTWVYFLRQMGDAR